MQRTAIEQQRAEIAFVVHLTWNGNYKNISIADFYKSTMRILYEDIWIRPNLALDIWYKPVKTLIQYYLFFGGYKPKENDDIDILSMILSEIIRTHKGGSHGNER